MGRSAVGSLAAAEDPPRMYRVVGIGGTGRLVRHRLKATYGPRDSVQSQVRVVNSLAALEDLPRLW